MKNTKYIAIIIAFVLVVQSMSVGVVSDTVGSDYIIETDTDNTGLNQTDTIQEIGAMRSSEAAEEDLQRAYEAFIKNTNEIGFRVIFDYTSFKEEYYTLGYSGVDEYLDALYGIFDFTSKEADSTNENENQIRDTTNSENSDGYRDGLGYSDEILQAYEDYSIFLTSKNIRVDLCLEEFAVQCEGKDESGILDYCENLKKESVELQKALMPYNYDLASTGGARSSGDQKYYYNIGIEPSEKPDYDDYNILQLAQKGDIILDEEGSFGYFGHAGIVEGKYYSFTHDCYYVRIIESIDDGICHITQVGGITP